MPLAGEARSLGPLTWFYVATPVFVVLDLLWGINIRIMVLDHLPTLKYVYYALCLGCGALTATRPSLTSVVGRSESALNLGLVCITIPVAYMRVLDSVVGGQDPTNPFTPMFFVNLGLSTAVAFWAYRRHHPR